MQQASSALLASIVPLLIWQWLRPSELLRTNEVLRTVHHLARPHHMELQLRSLLINLIPIFERRGVIYWLDRASEAEFHTASCRRAPYRPTFRTPQPLHLFTEECALGPRLIFNSDVFEKVLATTSESSATLKEKWENVRLFAVGPSNPLGMGYGTAPRRATALWHGPCQAWAMSQHCPRTLSARAPTER